MYLVSLSIHSVYVGGPDIDISSTHAQYAYLVLVSTYYVQIVWRQFRHQCAMSVPEHCVYMCLAGERIGALSPDSRANAAAP